jgi:hypothetical protein
LNYNATEATVTAYLQKLQSRTVTINYLFADKVFQASHTRDIKIVQTNQDLSVLGALLIIQKQKC